MIKYQDIITLNDNNKYVVASMVDYKNSKYVYLVNINDHKVMFAEISNNEVSVIDPEKENELIKELAPLFYNSSINDLEI